MANSKEHMYQSFPGREGSSDSQQKWESLKINDMSGLEVLDLGCNEGFFVLKALEAGAKRAVGVDRDQTMIASAKKMVPAGEFHNSDWLEFLRKQDPASFDVVFLLSAMHYAPEPLILLREIRRILRVDGLFVLEVSISHGAEPFLTAVERGSPPYQDIVRHPTTEKFRRLMNDSFSTRLVGSSVEQPGDPLPRFIFHATPRQPTALLIRGKPGAGKSDLAHLLGTAAPIYGLDEFLLHVIAHDLTPLGKWARENYKKSLDVVYRSICTEQKAEMFVASFVCNLQYEPIFSIEGFGLMIDEVAAPIKRHLNNKNVRCVDILLDQPTYYEQTSVLRGSSTCRN